MCDATLDMGTRVRKNPKICKKSYWRLGSSCKDRLRVLLDRVVTRPLPFPLPPLRSMCNDAEAALYATIYPKDLSM
jgi:hypothetical protein